MNILYFLHSGFLTTCACPENRGTSEFSAEYIFLLFRIFYQLCACPEKQSWPGIFHCIESTFYIQEFWATCTCPEKQSCPEFTVLSMPLPSGFLSNLHLSWKTEGALKIFTVLKMYFLSFRIFEQLALVLKNRMCPENFHCAEYIFYHSGFLSKKRLPWKIELPRNFSLHGIYFSHSGFLSNLRLPWKTELPWNFSLYWKCIFYHSRFLSNLCLPWKTELPWIRCIEYTFAFRIFEQLALAMKSTGDPENFHCIEYIFYHSGFFSK